MKQYPIWNKVNTNGDYKAQKDFGSRTGFNQQILVGSSSRNSHEFASVTVEKHETSAGRTFSLWIDGKLIKKGTVLNKELLITHTA